ncbi:MAG: DNA polymerase III subunit delta [Notoacmeibacter sp.]
MTELKAKDVESYLRRAPAHAIVLIYGPDRGLVSERANHVAKQSGVALDDPFSAIRLDATEIDTDPPRLVDEAATISMFGGKRLIWIKGTGGPKFVSAVTSLCENPPQDTLVLIEAGELKKDSALRKAAEKAAGAVTLPCYADEGRGVEALIDEMLSQHKLSIDIDARQWLKARLGGDRLASRSELEKLALYAKGQTKITLEDTRESAGDVSSLSIDAIVEAVLSGNAAAADLAFSKLVTGKQPAALVLMALIRQLQTLLPLRESMERENKSISSLVAAMRPPLFGPRKDFMERALANWPLDALARALDRLANATLESRKKSQLEDEIIRFALLGLASEAKRASSTNWRGA